MGVGDSGVEVKLLLGESSLRFSSCGSGKGQGSGETRWPLVDSCTVVICKVIAEVHRGQQGYYVDNFKTCGKRVGPQARLQFLFDYFVAILGAENYVHVIFGEGVRQCVAPCAARHARFRARRAAPGLDAMAPRLPRASALGYIVSPYGLRIS